MMKKLRVFFCVVVAVALVLAVGAPALAAESPVATGAVTVEGLPEGVTASAVSYSTPPVNIGNVYALTVDDKVGYISIVTSEPVADGMYKVTVTTGAISGVTSVRILHAANDAAMAAGNYTVLNGNYYGGHIVFYTPNFSSFAIVVKTSTGGAAGETTTTGTSPKTDDASPVSAILWVVAAAATCGAVFAGKKAFAK